MNITSVPIQDLKPHHKNPNTHKPQQIERLADLIKYQGWRLPIIVSKQSGFIVSGHGRLMAAQYLNLKEVPVSYQDFLDEDQEIAFLVSDNAIAQWSALDLSEINTFMPDFHPDFQLNNLGIEDFYLDPSDRLEKPIKQWSCSCGKIYVGKEPKLLHAEGRD